MSQDFQFANNMSVGLDSGTKERSPLAPYFQFYDDFVGAGALATIPAVASEENGFAWTKLIVGAAPPTVGVLADGAHGQVELALTSASQAQDAMLYWSDQRAVNLKADAHFEVRAAFSVIPTTGVAAVFGLAGNHNLAKDSITEHAWFRAEASGAILAETDDTTNDNDDVATGTTKTANSWAIYHIDFGNLADVKFYIDSLRVAGPDRGTDTTFDMSNLSDAEAVMQPYFGLDKASGTGVGTLLIDYVRIWSNRV